jgi:glycosyltransferase involved in cell wall biosynthesis
MKLILLANHARPGGITTYLTVLARELVRRGHRVLVVTGGGDASAAFLRSGAEHRELFLDTSSELNPRLLKSASTLRGWVTREGWQLAHAQTRVCQTVAALALRGLSAPRVTTCHGYFKTRFFRRLFPMWGDRVIAISRAVQRHLGEDWKLPPERITLVAHGVERLYSDEELAELRKRANDGLGARTSALRLGTLGRLSPVKGYHVLIEAMSLMRDIPVTLTLIGDGPEADRLDRMIRDLSLGERVRRLSSIPNDHVILHGIDVFCAPSLQEGLGLSVLDAMARGTSVIASRAGGLMDLIRDGETGRLVEPGNAKSLADGIRSLYDDPNSRERMAAAGRRFVEREFTLSRMIADTERVYESLVTPKH